jgi:hypothetical protein
VRSRLAGPLLCLEITRAATGSKLPAKKSASKLQHVLELDQRAPDTSAPERAASY